MLSSELEYCLNDAFRQARDERHEFMTVEHLLLALVEVPRIHDILRSCGADLDELRENLMQFVLENTPMIESEPDRVVQPTLGFQRVLQRALFHVQSSGNKEVTTSNVLVAIFSEKQSQAFFLLEGQGISRLDVVNYLSHGMTAVAEENPQTSTEEGGVEEDASRNPLQLYASNLNDMADRGMIDPLIGREQEIQRTVQILCRRRKNNPLFVGDAGVGKTALAEGLARLVVEGNVPELLKNTTIWSLDMGALVAGTKYRGDFEKRLKGVFAELEKDPDAVMFIDEIHTMIGAGSASGGVMDASNLIKPMLAKGRVRCIGSTTYEEFRGVFEKDHALARRFQKVEVAEPTVLETIDILKGLKDRFEEHHGISYTDDALGAAAELADRHIGDRRLPDKAIDVIDEAGAKIRLMGDEQKPDHVSVELIEDIVARMARVPPRSVSASDRDLLRNLERDLKLVIFGQDPAIQSLAAAIKMARSGLADEKRPVGSFLFAGPTGVGKTEVTRQLARCLGIELVRFDMSEYMERHTVSRLIGAPPGYVGYDQGGLLTEQINQQPHSVLLLDEIEKAHPEVFNILLQVMDHGTLTDNNGRKTDFRNVILVMTTNAGAQDISRESIGFTHQDHSSDGIKAIEKMFAPEFRNRLDSIIQFSALGAETVQRVADKLLLELETQLDQKQVSLDVDRGARRWVAKHGYDEKLGARPMARLIQERIKRPLAEELLFGDLASGGHVDVTTDDKGELIIRTRKVLELEKTD